jgi:hypothetical protein
MDVTADSFGFQTSYKKYGFSRMPSSVTSNFVYVRNSTPLWQFGSHALWSPLSVIIIIYTITCCKQNGHSAQWAAPSNTVTLAT